MILVNLQRAAAFAPRAEPLAVGPFEGLPRAIFIAALSFRRIRRKEGLLPREEAFDEIKGAAGGLLDKAQGADRVQLLLGGLDVVFDSGARAVRDLQAVDDDPFAVLGRRGHAEDESFGHPVV